MLGNVPSSGTQGGARDWVSVSIGPEELLERLEAASVSATALWKYVTLVPNSRPELRALLCHMWDGCTSDTYLAQRMRVHRHTIARWRKQLADILKSRGISPRRTFTD